MSAVVEETRHYDLVVVGAGIAGLSMVKTYKTVHPSHSILVLERANSVGGVWSKHRQYPGLKTNNHFGSFQFSDFPMNPRGHKWDSHIPGSIVCSYLEEFAQKFDLLRHVQFQSELTTARDLEEKGWELKVLDRSKSTPTVTSLKCSRLVVATGLTSQPLMPDLPGSESFRGPIVHSSRFSEHSGDWKSYKRVAVFGGAKFSWDTASVFASHGAQVEWIIRASGHGPCWMGPSRITPFKVVPENLLSTRIVTWLSPCIWGDADGYGWLRTFLHRTWLGRLLVSTFFNIAGSEVISENGYDSHPETKKLKPWQDFFWVGTNRGVLNYDENIFEQVRQGKIRVHIADVDHVSEEALHLSDGEVIQADMIVCGTGWKHEPQIEFVSDHDLSFPKMCTASPPETFEAEARVFRELPSLSRQPSAPIGLKPASTQKTSFLNEPYRLYRFMVPPSKINHRTLAFIGFVRSPTALLIMEIQGLWITSFFSDELSHLRAYGLDEGRKASDVKRDAVLHSQFVKLRMSGGFGLHFPDLWLESLPYMDLMLKELGVARHRKESAWKEIVSPYLPQDYEGIVSEWMNKTANLV